MSHDYVITATIPVEADFGAQAGVANDLRGELEALRKAVEQRGGRLESAVIRRVARKPKPAAAPALLVVTDASLKGAG